MMGDLDSWKWEDWTTKYGITRASGKIMSDQALNTVETLLAVDKGDIARIGLTVGQEALVRKAIRELGNSHFQDPVQVTTADRPEDGGEPTRNQNADPAASETLETSPLGTLTGKEEDLLAQAGRDLDTLLSNSGRLPELQLGKETGILSHAQTALRAPAYDPRHLLTLKASTRKAEKIASFLPERVKERLQKKRRERLVFAEGNEGQLSLQHNDDDNLAISPTEWGAANMRLMSHLLDIGYLARSEVEFYLAYTMQVFELAETYDWASIMRFDSRYRELQAQHGFCWGDMRLAPQLNLLTPRLQQPVTTRPRPARPNPREDCKKWLLSGGTSCPFGDRCRFAHRRLEPGNPPKNGQA